MNSFRLPSHPSSISIVINTLSFRKPNRDSSSFSKLTRITCCSSPKDPLDPVPVGKNTSSSFEVVGGCETVQDFVEMQVQELEENIKSRSDKMFLLIEELGLKLGFCEDFIRSMHLPLQLRQVDPVVAFFSGGAFGVASTLMLIKANNNHQQQKKRCKYCHGSGYLGCARCSANGHSASSDFDHPLREPTTRRCPNCSGLGKVICPYMPWHWDENGE